MREDVNVSVTGHTDHRCQCHTALLMSVSHGGAGEDLTKPPELRERVEATPGYSPLVIAARETRLQLLHISYNVPPSSARLLLDSCGTGEAVSKMAT